MFRNLTQTLKIGQFLMVETQNEILIGNLKLIGVDGKIIELENVRDFTTNYEYTSSQILPTPQIKNIKVLREDDNDDEEEQRDTTTETKPSLNSTDEIATFSPSSFSSTSRTSLLPEKAQPYLHNVRPQFSNSRPTNTASVRQQFGINLNNRELLHIQEQVESIVYIYQADQQYHKALADIKTQPVVSLVMEPMSFGRHKQPSLIAIGTNRVVYIFDMMNLGKMYREFKDIFEAKFPRKALHDGRIILDSFMHHQHLELGGVFDTFVAHCLITDENTHMNLVETVKFYFDISELYFTDQTLDQSAALSAAVYYNRPIPKSLLQLVAKKVIFQYKLYEYLLHEQMLGNFYQQCEQFTHAFSSNPDSVEVLMQMKPRKNYQGVQYINMNEPWDEFVNKRLN